MFTGEPIGPVYLCTKVCSLACSDVKAKERLYMVLTLHTSGKQIDRHTVPAQQLCIYALQEDI